ncbi:MAG: hypothetical protein AAF413_01410 [Patescibacteria group bacterium]
MKVAILGFAKQGKSTLRYYQALGADITVCDQNETIVDEIPEGVAHKLGPDYLRDLDQFDVLVRTPYMHPKKILVANAANPSIMQKVTTATNLFFENCDIPVIGVTGTKGV